MTFGWAEGELDQRDGCAGGLGRGKDLLDDLGARGVGYVVDEWVAGLLPAVEAAAQRTDAVDA